MKIVITVNKTDEGYEASASFPNVEVCGENVVAVINGCKGAVLAALACWVVVPDVIEFEIEKQVSTSV
jgi:hypothetical protein